MQYNKHTSYAYQNIKKVSYFPKLIFKHKNPIKMANIINNPNQVIKFLVLSQRNQQPYDKYLWIKEASVILLHQSHLLVDFALPLLHQL